MKLFLFVLGLSSLGLAFIPPFDTWRSAVAGGAALLLAALWLKE